MRKEQLSIFKNKRILVTGDTGFKGSWLVFWLKELGADVVGYSLPPEHPEGLFESAGLSGRIHHVDGDILDLSLLASVATQFQPEFVFHLAAQSLVRRSYENPKLTFDTNVAGSINVLEVIRKTGSIRSVVFITSDKCYANKEWVWGYRENDELGGYDPYSSSKAAAELAFHAYQSSFFKSIDQLGVASVRAGNVIGGGDWSINRIVPDCIRALKSNLQIRIRSPKSTRPWQHVLEPLSGYLRLAEKLYGSPKEFSGSWNFGPMVSSIRTVEELSQKIISLWGQGVLVVDVESNAPHEAQLLQLNCDKAFQLLKWQPTWDFDRTLEQTILWYKAAQKGFSSIITKSQIDQYMEDMK